jgi:hypothetical protein
MFSVALWFIEKSVSIFSTALGERENNINRIELWFP